MLSIFMCGYNEEKNNIKCDIEEEKEIFKLLNDYDVYSEVIDYNTLPTIRRKLIMVLNKNVSETVKTNINKMIDIINQAQKQEKGIYWY